MAHIEEHIDIAAPSSKVFQFCHDPAKRAEWDERVVRIELISPAPIRQGTLIQVDAGRGGSFSYSWEGEFTSFQYPMSSKVRVMDAAPSSPFKSGTEEWSFSAVGGATRFTLVWEYKPRNFLSRVGDALGGQASARRAVRHSLANLKAMIEADK